jgi:NAD(P) transhydrogenase
MLCRRPLTAAKRSLHRSSVLHAEEAEVPPGIPYKDLTVGVPRETYPSENRVAVTPAGVATLLKKGFGRVLVERGSGAAANFPDDAYAAAGAIIADTVKADITLKVRPPTLEQAAALTGDSTLISFLYPAVNKDLVEVLRKGGVNALAMDAIPRTSRAQTFDALSSMANTAGYRAEIEEDGSGSGGYAKEMSKVSLAP